MEKILKNNMLNDYSIRTQKSMKTIVKLEKTASKITNLTVNYLSNYALTFNQFKVLEALYHLGDLNIGSITKLTMSTPGNITVVIKNLIKGNFVTSFKDSKDSRISILSITKSGQDIIKKVFPSHSQNLSNAVKILDDKELDTLYNLLDKIYQAN